MLKDGFNCRFLFISNIGYSVWADKVKTASKMGAKFYDIEIIILKVMLIFLYLFYFISSLSIEEIWHLIKLLPSLSLSHQ